MNVHFFKIFSIFWGLFQKQFERFLRGLQQLCFRKNFYVDGRNTDLRDRENKHLHSCPPGAGTPLGGPLRGSNLSLFLFCIFYTRNVFLYQFTVGISPILTPRILFPRRRKHLRCSPTVSHFESHSVLYLPRENVFLIPIYKRNTMIIYPTFFYIEGWDGAQWTGTGKLKKCFSGISRKLPNNFSQLFRAPQEKKLRQFL